MSEAPRRRPRPASDVGVADQIPATKKKRRPVEEVPAAAKKKKGKAVEAAPGRFPRFGKVVYLPYAEKQNIGNLAKQLICMGKETQAVIDGVLAVKPDSKISASHISFYRKALTNEGYEL